jgi:hypothetical protein
VEWQKGKKKERAKSSMKLYCTVRVGRSIVTSLVVTWDTSLFFSDFLIFISYLTTAHASSQSNSLPFMRGSGYRWTRGDGRLFAIKPERPLSVVFNGDASMGGA